MQTAPERSDVLMPPVDVPQAVAAPRRIGLWDALRVVAFLDVVSLHLTDRHMFFGLGLPTFAMLTLGLATRRPVPLPTPRYLRARLRRLLLPWLAWSGLYAAVVLARAIRHHATLGTAFTPRMLLTGPELHLWFLPFAAGAGIAAHLVDRATQRLRTATFVPICFGSAAILLLVAARVRLPEPFGLWMFTSPAVPMGLAVGRMLARPAEAGQRAWVALAVASLAAAMVLGELLARGSPELRPAFRYALATALLAIGPLLGSFRDPWTAHIEPLLLGAYVSHGIVYAQVVLRLEAMIHLHVVAAANVLLTTGLTLAAVAGLRRTPARVVL